MGCKLYGKHLLVQVWQLKKLWDPIEANCNVHGGNTTHNWAYEFSRVTLKTKCLRSVLVKVFVCLFSEEYFINYSSRDIKVKKFFTQI